MADDDQDQTPSEQLDPEAGGDAERAELPDRVTVRGTDGELVLRLLRPKSLSTRIQLVRMRGDSLEWAFAAALGHCSVTLRQHVRPRLPLAEYGREVFDWLLEQGVSYADVLDAGKVAWLTCARDLPDLGRAKELANFTGAKPVAST